MVVVVLGGGIKNGPKKSDIFYGWPLRKSNIGSTHNVIYYNSEIYCFEVGVTENKRLVIDRCVNLALWFWNWLLDSVNKIDIMKF